MDELGEKELQPRKTAGRRKIDEELYNVPIVYRKPIARYVVIILTAVAGIIAERTVGITENIPGAESIEVKRESERTQLIQEFRQVQKELVIVRADLDSNKQIGEVQRVEILSRLGRLESSLDRLDTKLERWFEKAGR